jgi:hypothetical protein
MARGEIFVLVSSFPVHTLQERERARERNHATYAIHGHVTQTIINMKY